MTKVVLKKYIKPEIRVKNKHRFIAFGYAVAITFACLIALSNNNESGAFVSKDDSLGYLLLDSSSEAVFLPEQSLYPEKSLDNVKSLLDLARPSGPQRVEKEIKIQKGDTIISVLQSLGLQRSEANQINSILIKHFDPKSLKAGQVFDVSILVNEDNQELLLLESLIFEPVVGTRYVLSLNEKNDYVVEKEVDEHILEVNSASGTINGMLSTSMQKAGVSNSIVHQFTKIFSNAVDFRRDVKKGDTFEIVYENYISKNGQVIKTGNILYAGLQLRKTKIALYRFKDKAGNVDYFDAKGLAYSKRTLHRKPLAFQNARISSPFGRRRHPIYRDVRIHWGIDYAAPRGTAVYAGGDGVIQQIGYNGGYGKYIKIKHNSEYSTAYGHLNGYAKGVSKGTRVKQGQIIGYVGSTGRSTGPHLHYEVIQAGRRVNPGTIKASAGENLKGQNLKDFKNLVSLLHKTHSKMLAAK